MSSGTEERRFSGLIGKELKYTRLAYPDFDVFQGRVGEIVKGYRAKTNANISVLDIGCGYGFTAAIVLKSRSDLDLQTIDNEPTVIAQAHQFLNKWKTRRSLSIVEADALAYAQKAQKSSLDIVVSVLTLHNMTTAYRKKLLKEVARILKPSGIFINADKYALKGYARYKSLGVEIERYFNAFIPLEKYDLLKEWVLHHISDSAPERVMDEISSKKDLKLLGFGNIKIVYRGNMVAVLTATRKSL